MCIAWIIEVHVEGPWTLLSIRIGHRFKYLLSVSICLLMLGSISACTQPEIPNNDATENTDSSRETSLGISNFSISIYQGADQIPNGEVTLLEILNSRRTPIVVNFWAAECPPCRIEIPDLQEVHNRYKEEITIVGVDIGAFTMMGTEEQGQALLEELQAFYPAGGLLDAKFVEEHGISGVPTTIFLDRQGRLHRKWTGLLPRSKLMEIVQELLETP